MKICEIGRSMIEMLGVLAIVGVLSIGGITGYSKAMLNYKSNKQVNELSYLVFSLISHIDEIPKYKKGIDSNLIYYIEAWNDVPEDMFVKKQNGDIQNYLIDSLGNIINVKVYGESKQYFLIQIDLTNSSDSAKQACRNLFKLSKYYEKDIWQFFIYNDSIAKEIVRYYGNNYCTIGNNCLSKATIKDEYEACNSISNEGERISAYLSFLL